MISRERVINSLNHHPVDRAPRDLWAQPAVEKLHPDWFAEVCFRFPPDIERPALTYPRGDRAKGKPSEVGHYTDAWGCTWTVTEPGMPGVLRGPLLTEKAELARYKPPMELLEPGKLLRTDRNRIPLSKFVLAWTETRPFERLQMLRGHETALADVTHPTREVRNLLAVLHEFSVKEMELWSMADVDGVAFRDDWGASTGLLVPLKTWRELFKPLYRQYCDILHAHDKFVFFRSEGNIAEIFGDLVEIGVDAIHAQLGCMNLERLAEKFRGRVTFWGDVDRLKTLPLGTQSDVRKAVRQVRDALDFGRGGLISQCEWTLDVPFHNITAVFDEWLRPIPAHTK